LKEAKNMIGVWGFSPFLKGAIIYHFLVKVTLAFHPPDWLYPPPKLRDEFFDAGEETHLSESLS
jgi:hypothetical protein